MAQYDNGARSLWYRAEGESLKAILEIWDPARLANHDGSRLPTSTLLANLETLGVFDHLATQVEQGELGHPRAYTACATIWADPFQKGVFYIEAPVDYKGNHYAPPDAVPLDETETKRVTRSLSNGGQGGSIPLTAQFAPRNGTALPADFDATSNVIATDRYYKPDDFLDKAIFRASGKLQGDIHADVQFSKRVIHDYDGVEGLKDDQGRSPALWIFDEGYYLLYPDWKAAGAQAKHEGLKPVPPSEYLWARFNADDRDIGIAPPEPPKALDHLYEKTVFIARGLSHAALDRDYKTLDDMVKRLHAFEDQALGKPNPRRVFNVGGAKMRLYGDPSHEWLDDGTFKGFRFDWKSLKDLNAITAKPVPPGWTPVADHPGVYLPDPAVLPDEAKACATFNRPPLQRRQAISGADPIITISDQEGAAPCAERQWPAIYNDYDSQEGKWSYYIKVPEDYKGHVHRPLHSERMSTLRWEAFIDGLLNSYEPDSWIRPEPAPLPADFKPKSVAPQPLRPSCGPA